MRTVLASLHNIIDSLESYRLFPEADAVQEIFTRVAARQRDHTISANRSYAKIRLDSLQNDIGGGLGDMERCYRAFSDNGRAAHAAVIREVMTRLAAHTLQQMFDEMERSRLKFTRKEAKMILYAAGFTITGEDETHIRAKSEELRGIGGDMSNGTITIGCHHNNKRDAVSPRGHSDIQKAVGYILAKREEIAAGIGLDTGDVDDSEGSRDWQTSAEDTRYNEDDYRRYLPPSQRQASLHPLLVRFSHVVRHAEDHGMVRAAGVMQIVFESLSPALV